jgi:hypothetical protein
MRAPAIATGATTFPRMRYCQIRAAMPRVQRFQRRRDCVGQPAGSQRCDQGADLNDRSAAFSISSSASRAQRNAPARFTRSVWSQSDRGIASTGRVGPSTPALLIRKSNRPQCWVIHRNAWRTSPSWLTSHCSAKLSAPSLRHVHAEIHYRSDFAKDRQNRLDRSTSNITFPHWIRFARCSSMQIHHSH